MRKNYVLDTNVLIHDPQSIFQFDDNDLFIPIYVLEELDKLKNEQSLRGRNSREACRIIDDFRSGGSICEGVQVGEGTLRIFVPKERKRLSVALDMNSMDNAILQSAVDVRDTFPEVRTILVTMDVNLRIRAESVGVQTAVYESLSVDPSRMPSGQTSIAVEGGSIDQMFKVGFVHRPDDAELYDNQCVTLEEGNKTGLGRYNKKSDKICKLNVPREGIMGIRPRNKEQQFALDMLLDDSVKLVTLVGMAGTGKTLLAVAAGIQKAVHEGEYSRILISRPVVPMGKDLGFLPGTLEEKMDPWMQPIYDNLDFLMMTGGKKRTNGMNVEQLFDEDLIRVEPLTYIRGRTLPNQFVIIDESQNLSPHEIKTIITRCGEGSKIVLTGDPDQIDNPYMDKGSSGLSLAVEKLRGDPLVGHLTLSKGERSALANLAATCL